MTDIVQQVDGSLHADVLNKGHVVLEATMGSDLTIVNNARVSFDQESTDMGEAEEGLLNFLMRERHGSPWESVVFRFDVKAPIFVMREWARHRISSTNEQSARYSVIPSDFYVPERDQVRKQVGKPGSYSFDRIEDDAVAEGVRIALEAQQQAAYATYESLLMTGVAKEVARIVLPVGMYSRMKWTVNLRALFNFLSLRNDQHAQWEIREYAKAIEKMVKMKVPVAMACFEKHGRQTP